MKVILKYNSDALNLDEVMHQVKHFTGTDFLSVQLIPDGNDPEDFIYFGIQQLITTEQLSLIYDTGPLYTSKLAALRANVLSKLENITNEVIQDNENKVLG